MTKGKDYSDNVFEKLSEIERKILVDYYGLEPGSDETKSLQKIGDEVGVTGERIRQRREKAIAKVCDYLVKHELWGTASILLPQRNRKETNSQAWSRRSRLLSHIAQAESVTR